METQTDRTYGSLRWTDAGWMLQAEPHVAMWAKRIFSRIPADAVGTYTLTDSPSVCRDLEWFMQRFPLAVAGNDLARLLEQSQKHRDKIARLNEIIDQRYKPRLFKLALPPRDYQRRAAELWLARKGDGLLLADDVGLGKTASTICGLVEGSPLPAVVVCLAHLPKQWEREINRFAPGLHTHVLEGTTPYKLPRHAGRGPDVLITSYNRLQGWASVLVSYCKGIVFDEVQELRHRDTAKYGAAKAIAGNCAYRLGLSATPIYNYGGEVWNIVNMLSPGSLGTWDEFVTEWCKHSIDVRKATLRDPDAFGAWMREQHLMLKRTRKEVGRELPGLSKITHTIDCDESVLRSVEGKAGELARLILTEVTQARGVKMRAAEEFSNLLRQATGLAKAPFVAEFVKLLLENGENIVLYGWHRAVYEIWRQKLADYNPVFFTGEESPAAKDAAVEKFVRGDSRVFIMSLRAGAGVDGLQRVCRTAVFGEIDWSPGVHVQCVGRLDRDGQKDPVTAYFLLAEDGADPMMAEVLGIKRDQCEGLVGRERDVLQRDDSAAGMRKLAEQYLRRA